MMIFYLDLDGVFALAAARASSSTCSTGATSATSLRTSSSAACAFATHVCAVLSMSAMDMSLAGLVMGIGAASAPLRSPRARSCACSTLASAQSIAHGHYGRVHVLNGHGRTCDESLRLPLCKGRVFDIRVIDVAICAYQDRNLVAAT